MAVRVPDRHLHWLTPVLLIGFAFLRSNAASPQSTSTELDLDQQFKPIQLTYNGGRYTDENFAYRLYVPSPLEEGRKYPLVIWLHGAGEAGKDNQKNLLHIRQAVRTYTAKHGPMPAFILAPQIPSTEIGWFDHSANSDDMLTVSLAMLERTIQEYSIDEDRIALLGVSSGGDACWEMVLRYPQRFAAIAPLASSGGDESRASRLVYVPIWSFHNTYDKSTPIEGARRMVDAVRMAGGRAKITEIRNVGHGAWAQALYENSELIEWLLERRRGESRWICYFQFVDGKTIAAQCGLPAAVFAACLVWFWNRKSLAARREPAVPIASDLEASLTGYPTGEQP